MILNARMIAIGLGLAAMLEVASAAESATAVTETTFKATQPTKRLDLRAPDITKLYSAEQLNRMLARTLKDDIEEVEVEGRRVPLEPRTPAVWGGIAAPIWAILHPTQSWRIFAPLPPDQARGLADVPAIAPRGYLEPAATIPR
ncbi:MAG: hypothetical protein ACREUC_17185 [Steroidobacteraceae bacterium]